jgi:hypothetical protein
VNRGKGFGSASLALLVLVAVLSAACLPDPHLAQVNQLYERLAAARVAMVAQPPVFDDNCTAVGDVRTRLYGEPGLVDVQPAWQALSDASAALLAACGETAMRDQATNTTEVSAQARQRWSESATRELVAACDDLRAAATALSRPTPC